MSNKLRKSNLKGVVLELDVSQIVAAMQSIGSIGDVLVDDLPDIALQTAKRLAKHHFTEWIDMRAKANRRNLWHMYEWGRTGEADARLWDIVFHNAGEGRGVASSVSIRYKENTVPVPRPDNRMGGGDGRNAEHVFRFQARVLEEYLTTSISPTQSTVLVWWSREDQDWVFRYGPVVTRYVATHGQFTAAFNEYWGGVGVPAVEMPIKSTVERVLQSATADVVAKSARHMAGTKALPGIGFGQSRGMTIAFQVTTKGKRGLLNVDNLLRGQYGKTMASEETRRKLIEELDALGASQEFVE